MRRREFFGFAGGAASAWAVNAFAQQMYRVAVLTPSHTQWQPRTFRDAMQELGYREDVNLNLTVVSGENQLDRMPKLAADLVASAPDVIVAVNTPGTRAAIAATSKIPIVSAIVADPVFFWASSPTLPGPKPMSQASPTWLPISLRSGSRFSKK